MDNKIIISRITSLCQDLNPLIETAYAKVGTKECLEQRIWLSQALLIINEVFPTSHSFCKLGMSYVTGGGAIGVEGMAALLMAAKQELKDGGCTIPTN